MVAARHGEMAQARRALGQALAYDEELRGAATGHCALALLADVEADCGDLAGAEECLRGFLGRGPSTGSRWRGLYPDDLAVAFAVPILGGVLVRQGKAAEAREVTSTFVETIRPAGMPYFLSWALTILASAQLALADRRPVRTCLDEARALVESIDNPWLMANADHLLAVLARADGDLGPAERRTCATRPWRPDCAPFQNQSGSCFNFNAPSRYARALTGVLAHSSCSCRPGERPVIAPLRCPSGTTLKTHPLFVELQPTSNSELELELELELEVKLHWELKAALDTFPDLIITPAYF